MRKQVTLLCEIPEGMSDGRLSDMIGWIIRSGQWDARATLDECDPEDEDAIDAVSIHIVEIDVSN